MIKLLRSYWPLLVILVVTGFLFTFRLGRDLLWDWDECLYGQYAKEMMKSGHYLTNIWNGYIDLQKPPLYSWLLSIPAFFGRSELNLRLLNVVASLGLLSSVYIFAKQYFSQRVAILSSLLLLTAEVFVIYSMKLSTDAIYSFFIFLGVWGWLNSKQKGWLWGGVFFGLATMTKGLGVSQFLAALFISLFLNFRKGQLWNFIKMGLVVAAISLPWHVITYLSYGNHFFKVYIEDNILKRSKYPIEFHRERIWFYFSLLYRELFPWLFAAFIPVIRVMLNLFQHPNKILKRVQDDLRKHELIFTLLLLIVVPLIMLTKVQTRIAWYLMPLYPFLAIYLGYCLNLLIELISRKNKVLRSTLFVLFVIFIAIDAGRLILNETKFNQSTRKMDARQEVQLVVSKQKETTLNYLVPFGERQAKEILPPTEQIDMTWVYGGNGCMVYYGDKKTNYIYEIPAFEQALKKPGLFLISNHDSKYAEGKKILFKNTEYILFIQ